MALPKFQGASEQSIFGCSFSLSGATLRDFSARENVKLFRFPSVRVFGKASRENELTRELVPLQKVVSNNRTMTIVQMKLNAFYNLRMHLI